MKVVSVQVGLPKEYLWNGESVISSILKVPVEGRIPTEGNRLRGDSVSDPEGHGGPSQAIYGYAADHYEYWREALPDTDLPWGAFGENLTIEGLSESTLKVGDRLRVGTAELVATCPRMPCFKLGIRLDREDAVARFTDAMMPGSYFGILVQGEIGKGDKVELVAEAEGSVSILELMQIRLGKLKDPETLAQAISQEWLPESWKSRLRSLLAANH